jgi:hypothetical protein
MSIIVASSSKTTINGISAELHTSLANANPKLLVFFSSPKIDPIEFNAELKKLFPDIPAIGCTTAGEIVSGKMMKNSVVVMSIGTDVLDDVAIGIVENVNDTNQIIPVFSHFEKHFKTKMTALDFSTFVGIILVDGLKGAEESVMDKIGTLTDITFIGGSAGDDLAFKQTKVFANGKVYTGAAILALMKVNHGFDIIKTQSFNITDKVLIATKVDEPNRIVHEFNNKPATEAYAELLGISVSELPNHFMQHPVGMISPDGQPFVRSPQQVKGSSICFYCNIKAGMELRILESTDIIADTRSAIQSKINEIGKISGIINFHCILRTLELEQKNRTEQYGDLFKSIPSIGFSTYGEQYIGHINQTSTMLVFK